MKKILALILALIMLFTLAACNTNNNGTTSPSGNDTEVEDNTELDADSGEYELALITDLGTIDDRSFNQGAWEGVEMYAKEFDITHKYYKPADAGDDAYLNAIDLAVQSGAKVIVTPGFLFEVPIFVAQDRYPDVKFILLDGTPNNGDWDNYEGKVGDNTIAVFYAEEQAGFLAGYAAVMDGYRNLGFMGGISVPAVVRFGLGYIQGAEYAAQELGLEDDSITLNYFYTGTFEPSPDINTRAAAWYNDGIEVIFACGGGICFSIFPAAEQSGNAVIGVDGDQSSESESVITSAMKLLTQSVYDCLEDYYADEFPGGETLLFDAANLGVGLPMDTSKFDTFTQADYDAIFAMLVDGTVFVDPNTEIAPDEIPTSAVVVNNLGG
ncbi:MAG: BMP family ABC transporter substrate-binding protein [Oscillospiraceae bacterium]|nr:BMP family ABC transporter substrate-binding protein [Oscillospiraceae bacterium]